MIFSKNPIRLICWVWYQNCANNSNDATTATPVEGTPRKAAGTKKIATTRNKNEKLCSKDKAKMKPGPGCWRIVVDPHNLLVGGALQYRTG